MALKEALGTFRLQRPATRCKLFSTLYIITSCHVPVKPKLEPEQKTAIAFHTGSDDGNYTKGGNLLSFNRIGRPHTESGRYTVKYVSSAQFTGTVPPA